MYQTPISKIKNQSRPQLTFNPKEFLMILNKKSLQTNNTKFINFNFPTTYNRYMCMVQQQLYIDLLEVVSIKTLFYVEDELRTERRFYCTSWQDGTAAYWQYDYTVPSACYSKIYLLINKVDQFEESSEKNLRILYFYFEL